MTGIIVEGPDGAGKTTLIRQLLEKFPEIELVEKPADSLDGPRPNLDIWVEWFWQHTVKQEHPILADRHPMISEYIYGPTIRETLGGQFISPGWTAEQLSNVYRYCAVVWCLPPLPVVVANVQHTQQMLGVQQLIRHIWLQYFYASRLWSGPKFTYDYTSRSSLDATMHYVNQRIRSCNG